MSADSSPASKENTLFSTLTKNPKNKPTKKLTRNQKRKAEIGNKEKKTTKIPEQDFFILKNNQRFF